MELFAEIGRFDYRHVVLEGPALLDGIEADLLARYADALLVVCRLDRLSPANAAEIGEALSRIDVPTVGLVALGGSAVRARSRPGHAGLACPSKPERLGRGNLRHAARGDHRPGGGGKDDTRTGAGADPRNRRRAARQALLAARLGQDARRGVRSDPTRGARGRCLDHRQRCAASVAQAAWKPPTRSSSWIFRFGCAPSARCGDGSARGVERVRRSPRAALLGGSTGRLGGTCVTR